MEKEIKISVVICAYNAERFIEQAIDSVFNQDFPASSVEIVVVDDGSKDRTAKILNEKYAGRIKYIFRKNGGHTSAINTALEYVNGEYVCFLDSDDYWDKQKLREIFNTFESDKTIDVIYNYYKVVDENRCVIEHRPGEFKGDQECLAEHHLREYLAGRTPFCPPTSGISVRNSCIKQIGRLPEEVVFPDFVLWNILPLYFRKMAYVTKYLHFYRIHGTNTVGNNPASIESTKRDLFFAVKLQGEIEKHAKLLNKEVSLVLARLEQSKNKLRVEILKYEGNNLKALWFVLTYGNIIFRKCRYQFAYRIYFRTHTILYTVIPKSIFNKIRIIFIESVFGKLFHNMLRWEKKRWGE
ncbi:MAG: glycosyltransferase [bacterium]|nr:glycosyltransferase [bacterium]